jgi:hypothetical protein
MKWPVYVVSMGSLLMYMNLKLETMNRIDRYGGLSMCVGNIKMNLIEF